MIQIDGFVNCLEQLGGDGTKAGRFVLEDRGS